MQPIMPPGQPAFERIVREVPATFPEGLKTCFADLFRDFDLHQIDKPRRRVERLKPSKTKPESTS